MTIQALYNVCWDFMYNHDVAIYEEDKIGALYIGNFEVLPPKLWARTVISCHINNPDRIQIVVYPV